MFRKAIYPTVWLLCLVAATTTHASVLVPAGLNPGDMYHLGFVTQGTTDATSTDIADYNAFVQGQAALNPTLTGTDMGVTYKAIASTSVVDARDNALVEAPVFLMDGTTQISTGFLDTWDGSIAANLSLDQFGDQPTTGLVWTGSLATGFVRPDRPLGSSRPGLGSIFFSNSRWVEADSVQPDHVNFRFYALSEKLSVPTSGGVIPEPASVVVWLGLASVLGVGTRLRRRVGRRA